jgi:lipoate-protein ligase A
VARWSVEHFHGTADEFHRRPIPEPSTASVWVHHVEGRALVLGSSQNAEVVDRAACHREEVAVVRRRSGGGAVLVEPGGVVWIDVIVPAGDPLWDNDIGTSTWWLGEAWADALVAVGAGRSAVHRGAMVTTRWSSLVCFAGVGPGEVVTEGRKVVGISQRRTRGAARFQCCAYRAWEPGRLVRLLHDPKPPEEELAPMATGAGPGFDLLCEALVVAVTER